jgi:hypothetical protein
LTLFAFQAAAMSPVVGSLVWVEDPDEAWIAGEVVKADDEDIKVLCTSGKTVSALNNIFFDCVLILIIFPTDIIYEENFMHAGCC